MEITQFDAIIIGSGQAGTPLARFLAEQHWNTAIIERHEIGGTCVNNGCTPTKTLIGTARIAHLNRISDEFGISHSDLNINIPQILSRKNHIVESSRHSLEKSLESNGNIHLYRGEARFIHKNSLLVTASDGTQKTLQSARIFINTGCSNTLPDIPGLRTIDVLDSTSIMEVTELPAHLIILGASYIALEFGQLFRRLGSRVSIIERKDQILSREDRDVAMELQGILEKEGIEFHLSASIESVQPGPQGGCQVKISQAAGSSTLQGTHLFAALGRLPNTHDLDLDKAGIRSDEKGYIQVNEFLETNIEGIYALGDVKGGPAFTHISYDDFRIVRNNLFQSVKKSTKDRIIPYCVFTDPELGRTGLTEREAQERNIKFRVAFMPMTHVARAIESGETAGFMKALVETGTDKIIGASVLSVHGGEISSLLHLAIVEGIPYTHIRDGIFAHPTFAESLNNLFTTFKDEPA